jgi:hypothetical protein
MRNWGLVAAIAAWLVGVIFHDVEPPNIFLCRSVSLAESKLSEVLVAKSIKIVNSAHNPWRVLAAEDRLSLLVRSLRRDANRFFKDNAVPLEIRLKNGYCSLCARA